MGILEDDKPKTLTRPHVALIQVLRYVGFDVEVEASFYPKSVDCYVSDYHVAFEADGPQHSREKDMDRDAYLMGTYALPVFHIPWEHLLKSNTADVLKAVIRPILDTSWLNTRVERRMVAWKAKSFFDGEVS